MPSAIYSSIVFDDVRIYDSLKIAQGGGLFKTYTEEGLHRPFAPSFYGTRSDGTQIFSFQNVTPHIGEETSVLRLPFAVIVDETNGNGSGSAIMDKLERMRFIDITYTDSYGQPAVMYGWVDGYRITGSGGPQSTVEIRWHLDYYLSYPYPGYGAGRILRGPQNLARPDDTPPRKWVFSSKTDIIPASSGNQWVVFLVADDNRNYLKYFQWGGSITGSGPCPTADDVYGGNILTLFGVSSQEVMGAWICPFNPIPVNGNVENNGNKYWYSSVYYGTAGIRRYIDVTETTTDDNTRVSVTNQLGTVVGTVPWGTTFDQISIIQDIGPSGANLVISFYKNTSALSPYGPHNLEGRMITMSLEPIPVFGFALSDYIYSGQRQFDIENAAIQRNQAAVNGIANIGTSAIGGAVAGSMVAPGPGTVAGAVAGVVSGTVGTAVGFYSAGHFDAKSQRNTDRLMADQGGSAIISGGGDLWDHSEYALAIITSVRDTVSAAEMSNEQSELGYITDSYSTDCTALISDGGGLRIEGLEVKDVGPAGQRYISSLFARGVHIDISSP